MAHQKGKFISGVLGPVIYKVVNGKQVIAPRPAPGTIKQTAATKRASNTFGMASCLSAAMRKALAGQLYGFYDYWMVNRLNGKVATILNTCRDPVTKLYQFDTASFSSLDSFEFNSSSKVSKLMGKAAVVVIEGNDLTVTLSVPDLSQALKFPGKSFQCHINVSVSLFRLKEGLMRDLPETQSLLVYKNRLLAEPHSFEFFIPNGCLCVVTLFLVYEAGLKTGWKSINNKNLNPGCICKAFISPGKYQDNGSIIWKKMIKLK